jgi:4-carboxymuconolactone decarboxylase
MTNLTDRERELVALGAAMGSNCVPCMEHHIPAARKAGLSDAQIVEAVRLADKVRQVPARKVLDVSLAMLGETANGPDAGQPDRGGRGSA